MAEEEVIDASGPTTTKEDSINNDNESNDGKDKKENLVDLELFSCLLQPASSDLDPNYIGIRRLLLFRKAESGFHRRLVSVFVCHLLTRISCYMLMFWMFELENLGCLEFDFTNVGS